MYILLVFLFSHCNTVLVYSDTFIFFLPFPPAPDGSLRASPAVDHDAVTGLMRPNAHSHMLLNSGHTMAVPPNFFLHPQTGRVMPIIGNVAYDPASSTLVVTTDLCRGNAKEAKYDHL